MLIEFKVANYRSIRAEQTLSMVASNYSDELPQNLISCDHVPGLKGTKLVKAVALYGANASGKSNIVAALRFFAEFVRDSATKYQPNDPTGAQPFKLDPACLTEPSKFEITAVINGIRTLYGLEMTRERVKSEYLVVYPMKKPRVLFEREWNKETEKYIWSKSTKYFRHDKELRAKTRANAAFLAVAAQFNVPDAIKVCEWQEEWLMLLDGYGNSARTGLSFESVRKILASQVSRADLGIVSLDHRKADKREAYIELIESWFKDRRFVKEVATGKYSLPKIKEDSDYGKDSLTPQFLHRAKAGPPVALDFRDEESLGTQQLFDLAGDLLYAQTYDQFLVVDEIEASLHPLLVDGLLRSFLNGVLSSKAQLLFTTHNPLLLDQTLLRRDQIWFTEKDQEGATRLYPLTDFKPRKDESLVKGYLAGRYGGIPFIPEGLKF